MSNKQALIKVLGLGISSKPDVNVVDGFGSTSTTEASSINNATILKQQVDTLVAEGKTVYPFTNWQPNTSISISHNKNKICIVQAYEEISGIYTPFVCKVEQPGPVFNTINLSIQNSLNGAFNGIIVFY